MVEIGLCIDSVIMENLLNFVQAQMLFWGVFILLYQFVRFVNKNSY